jgi:hypothetical protein
MKLAFSTSLSFQPYEPWHLHQVPTNGRVSAPPRPEDGNLD